MKPVAWKVWRFILAPLVDEWTGLSLTRFLAIGCFALAAWNVGRGGPLTANVVWLLTLAIAAAFGKATFTAIASRGSWSGTTTDTTAHVITEQITTRRDGSDHPGTEPTP